jgi:hypothetical protein
MTTSMKNRNLATSATFALAAAATVLLASNAQAQAAVPPNDWLNSAVMASKQEAVRAPASTLTRATVQDGATQSRPSPFADSYPSRGSVHNARFVSQVTRAEVMADAQIWRESGLAQLDAGESPDRDSAPYRQAQAKYDELRASPYFATLVQRFGATPDRLAMTGR